MRALRVSLVVLAVLALLFVAADRIAVNLAEEEAAEKVRTAQGLSQADSVSVSIHGFPFLTQAAGKQLDEVTVDLRGMTAETGSRKITVTRVDARLTDVVLGGNFDSAVAKEASGTAEISYKDLNSIAPEGVRVEYAGKKRAAKGQVKMTASISILGRLVEIPKPIYSTVKINGGDKLQLHAESIPGSSVPGAAAEIRERVDFGSKVDGLPDRLELDESGVNEKGLEFDIRGENVRLAG